MRAEGRGAAKYNRCLFSIYSRLGLTKNSFARILFCLAINVEVSRRSNYEVWERY